MAVEGIAATGSAAVQPTDTGQNAEQDRISELVKLKQDVQKLKSDYKERANQNGMTQTEINSKIRKYEKLIAKIEQQIQQMKKKKSLKPVELHKGQSKAGKTFRKTDSTDLSVAALKRSYRMLLPANGLTQQVPDVEPADLQGELTSNLNELV